MWDRNILQYPKSEPCTSDPVGIDEAALFDIGPSGVICRICRHALIDVTTYADDSPQYLHGHPVPPQAIDRDNGDSDTS